MKKQVFFTVFLLFATLFVSAQTMWSARYDSDGAYEAQASGAAGPQTLIDGASTGDKIVIYNQERIAIDLLNVGVEITIEYNYVDSHNQAPVASDVTFAGTLIVDEELTGSYTYNDNESDPEGTTTFQWYRGDDASGTNPEAISGAISSTYTLTGSDDGKYIALEVTPVAAIGTSPGTAVMSTWQGAVTSNQAPVVSSVTFSGNLIVDEELTGSYTYSDNESDPEGATTFQWYRGDDASGTNPEAISGATSSTYTLTGDDEGKHIALEVTPVASSGTSPGIAVMSPWQGPAATPGFQVVEVTNPNTGKTWLDRNLGASQVATSSTDYLAYGDLYQWGRAADGHQTIVWTSSTTSDGAEQANETISLSNSNTPGHGDFILTSDAPNDWRDPQKDDLWQGVSGINNPCPSGFRLPTEAEWEAERASWISNDAAGAIASPLKLPVAGYRNNSNGSLDFVGSDGGYWSSTVEVTNSRYLYFNGSFANMYGQYRAYGFSVRCIKD